MLRRPAHALVTTLLLLPAPALAHKPARRPVPPSSPAADPGSGALRALEGVQRLVATGRPLQVRVLVQDQLSGGHPREGAWDLLVGPGVAWVRGRGPAGLHLLWAPGDPAPHVFRFGFTDGVKVRVPARAPAWAGAVFRELAAVASGRVPLGSGSPRPVAPDATGTGGPPFPGAGLGRSPFPPSCASYLHHALDASRWGAAADVVVCDNVFGVPAVTPDRLVAPGTYVWVEGGGAALVSVEAEAVDDAWMARRLVDIERD